MPLRACDAALAIQGEDTAVDVGLQVEIGLRHRRGRGTHDPETTCPSTTMLSAPPSTSPIAWERMAARRFPIHQKHVELVHGSVSRRPTWPQRRGGLRREGRGLRPQRAATSARGGRPRSNGALFSLSLAGNASSDCWPMLWPQREKGRVRSSDILGDAGVASPDWARVEALKALEGAEVDIHITGALREHVRTPVPPDRDHVAPLGGNSRRPRRRHGPLLDELQALLVIRAAGPRAGLAGVASRSRPTSRR